MAFGALSSPSCQTCGCGETSCASCKNPTDCSNCADCCCSTTHSTWRQIRIGTGIRVEFLSSGWMIIEVLGSIAFGLVSGSFALLAFGGDSLIELTSGFAVLTHLRNDVGGSEMHSRRIEVLTSGLLFSLIPVIALGAAYSYSTGLRPEG